MKIKRGFPVFLAFLTICVQLFFSCEFLSGNNDKEKDGKDVTSVIKNLGNIKEHISGSNSVNFAYARNVWDMYLFGNRIYIGYGSWANSSPSDAVNKGPIPIIAIDTAADQFVREEVYVNVNGVRTHRPNGADDEQLWIFREINGKLYAPGTDARGTVGAPSAEGWDWGNYYIRQTDGTWLKRPTIPGGIHILDIIGFNGKLYTGIGGNSEIEGSVGIMYSADDGETWSAPENLTNTARNYTLIAWGNSLYAFAGDSARRVTTAGQPQTRLRGRVIDANNSTTDSTTVLGIFSEVLDDARYIIRKYAFLGNSIAFILYKQGETNDSWELPAGLHYASSFSTASTISTASLPNPSAEAIDIISRNNDTFAYILANVKNGNDYTVIVYKTSNLINFETICSFRFGTFARSFEEHNKNFYFGMGTMDGEPGTPSELAGTIIKIPFEEN